MTDEILTAINSDLILKELDLNNVEHHIVRVVTEKTKQGNEIRYYKVLGVGPKVTDAKVGDTVMVSWVNTAPSFFWNGEKVTISSESKVIAVVENE